MKTQEIEYNYDKTSDVLYAFVGERKQTKNIEKGNGITIRIDPETNEPIGFIVVDYKKRITQDLLKSIPLFDKISLPIY